MSDLLPFDLQCPKCGSIEADFLIMLTDPDLKHRNWRIYRCKCDYYLIVKNPPEPIIDYFPALENALTSARVNLLYDVLDLARETCEDEPFEKAERLFWKLKIFFNEAFRHYFELYGDETVKVRLLPLKDSIRVEIYKTLAYCHDVCIRDLLDLAEPKTLKIGNRFVWQTFANYFLPLIQLQVFWLDVDEDDSTCIRDILRFAFG